LIVPSEEAVSNYSSWKSYFKGGIFFIGQTITYFPQSSYTITYGSTFSAPEATVKNVNTIVTSPAVTYASSNTTVATVDASTGAVTINAVGTTTITATYAGNSFYYGSSASYTLTVNESLTTTTFPQPTYNIIYGSAFTAPQATVKPFTDGQSFATLVSETADAWHTDGLISETYAPLVETEDGRSIALAERYVWNAEETGTMLWQEVTGLENATYTVVLYANACFTPGRGFNSSVTEGQTGIAYVYANDQKQYVPVHVSTTVGTHGEFTLTTDVTDGTLRLGLVAEQVGTNWWSIQIKSLAKSPTLTYQSSNTNVATVNSRTGAVTIKKAGTTTITAKFAGDTNHVGSSGSYTLNVFDATCISFASPNVTLQGKDKTLTLTPTISDPRITTSNLTWSSSDETIATVSQTGTVTSKGYGTVTITCRYLNILEASCRVTIYKEGLIYIGNIFYGISEDNSYAYVTNCAGGKPTDELPREEYSATVNIPANITHDGVNYPVKAVGEFAFFHMKDLQAVVVPTSVQEFGYRSFEKSANLGRVSFMSTSAGLLSVGERAFYECTKLNNVNLPNTTQRIDKEAFRYCISLNSISFGTSLNYINEFALADCPILNNVTLPQSLKSIQNGAFLNDIGLTAIIYPQALEGIGSSAFANCTALTDVTFNNANYTLTVGEDAFLGSNAIRRVLVKNLGAWVSINFSNPSANPASIAKHLYATDGTEIINAVVPQGAIYVNNNVFYNCSSLQSITLPATIQFVNDNIIYGCTALRKMTCKAKAVPTFLGTLDPSTMNSVFQATTLYVPEASLNTYKNDSYWKRFKQILKDESGDVSDFIPGDANGDNKVNGTDIVVIANMVLGRKDKNVAADANQDGKVNGTDIVVVANIVLGRASAPVRKAPAVTASGSATLSIEPFDITAGSEATMTIDLNNPDDVLTLVQFDLTLPKGLSVKTVGGDYDIDMAGRTSWRKHSLDANLNDGYYTFLLKSDSNTPIDGTSGGIITVTLVADASFAGGKIVIDNTVLTTPEEVEINPARYEYSLGGNEPTPVPEGTCLFIEPFSITAGSEATMTIDLNNPDDVLTLVQFDLTLPEGLSIKTVGGDYDIDMAGRTSWRKHSLDANLNDGYYTFLLKSDSNTPIDGTEGGIITVTLVADATFGGGKIVIDNTVLTTPEEVEINPARYEYGIGYLTGIAITSMDEEQGVIYDLHGRRVTTITRSGIYIRNGKKFYVK